MRWAGESWPAGKPLPATTGKISASRLAAATTNIVKRGGYKEGFMWMSSTYKIKVKDEI